MFSTSLFSLYFDEKLHRVDTARRYDENILDVFKELFLKYRKDDSKALYNVNVFFSSHLSSFLGMDSIPKQTDYLKKNWINRSSTLNYYKVDGKVKYVRGPKNINYHVIKDDSVNAYIYVSPFFTELKSR